MQIRYYAYQRIPHWPRDEYIYFEFENAKARDAFVAADPHRDTLQLTRGNTVHKYVHLYCREVSGIDMPEGCTRCFKEYGREVQ